MPNPDVVFTKPYWLDPLNLTYLSELYRLRVIIPTQRPIISLSTLHGLRCLNRARLGTVRNRTDPACGVVQILLTLAGLTGFAPGLPLAGASLVAHIVFILLLIIKLSQHFSRTVKAGERIIGDHNPLFLS